MNYFLSRLQPFEAVLRARMGISRSLEETSITHKVLAPEEKSEIPPVVIASEDRARVTKAQAETAIEREWMRIDGAVALHQATVRYAFKNVLATPFGFFVGGNGFSRFGRPRVEELLTVKIDRVAKGFFATSPICQKYFGHWLLDGLPLTLLAHKEEALFLPYDPHWQHAPAYLDLLGISRIPSNYVFFDEMSYCVDIGQNDNRRDRTRRMRDRLQAAVRGNGNKLVYLERGQTGVSRQIVNESELIAALEQEGFTTVQVDAPLAEIIEACHGASTVISVEGSHMTHGLLAAAEGAMHITLNPCDRFNNVFADYMPSLRSRLGTIVMERVGSGYRVNIDHIMKFLRRDAAII